VFGPPTFYLPTGNPRRFLIIYDNSSLFTAYKTINCYQAISIREIRIFPELALHTDIIYYKMEHVFGRPLKSHVTPRYLIMFVFLGSLIY